MAEIIFAVSEAGDQCDQILRHDLPNKCNSSAAVVTFVTFDIKAKIYLVEIGMAREGKSPQDLGAKEAETDQTNKRTAVVELSSRSRRNRDRDYCTVCGLIVSTDKIVEVGEVGRLAAQSPRAQASRAETQRRNAIAQHAWRNDGQAQTAEMYQNDIQPGLSKISVSAIATALRVSWSYAADIRRGKRRPHPRHWETLERLGGVPPEQLE